MRGVQEEIAEETPGYEAGGREGRMTTREMLAEWEEIRDRWAYEKEKARKGSEPAPPPAQQVAKEKRAGSSSRYLGVSWCKSMKRWNARVTYQTKPVSAGYFRDEIEAARAYDKKAISLFGDRARLNFPDEARARSDDG